ncbi:hypothetical protein GCM10007049_12160 [Echinicola pacifica]|uniref:Uncharacterized protein n=1 Tax=Echinicola pacifica TaxID=346377 RepID=A0A918PS67_9BACT|nr:hypothetical protein GCM10007049_12160 [Echinicola pacifica]
MTFESALQKLGIGESLILPLDEIQSGSSGFIIYGGLGKSADLQKIYRSGGGNHFYSSNAKGDF